MMGSKALRGAFDTGMSLEEVPSLEGRRIVGTLSGGREKNSEGGGKR